MTSLLLKTASQRRHQHTGTLSVVWKDTWKSYSMTDEISTVFILSVINCAAEHADVDTWLEMRSYTLFIKSEISW